jgi:hypothetical protein
LGDTVSVRPRLFQRFRPFRRRDREVTDPHQRQKEQRDLQRGIAQDCFCRLADQCAGVNHGARFHASRNGRATLSEHGNAVKYGTDYLRLKPPEDRIAAAGHCRDLAILGT